MKFLGKDFKYFEDDADELRENNQGTILPLWIFTDPLIKGMYISSVCWHPSYADLFAVGLSKNHLFSNLLLLIYINSQNYRRLFKLQWLCHAF